MTNKQNEETIHRLGENICNLIDQQGITLRNLQMAHVAQYNKKKIKSWAENLNRYFSEEEMDKKHMKKCLTLLITTECKSELQ